MMVFETGVTLRQLRFFRAVVEAHSFSAAARNLDVTQSTVSYEIACLERLVGAPLLVRHQRWLQMTNEGRTLYECARRVLAAIDETATIIQEYRGIQRGRLTVGADAAYATYVLPKILATFSHDFPKVELHVEMLTTPELVRAVKAGSLELAIVADDKSWLQHDVPVTSYPVADFAYDIAAPRDHPFAGQRMIGRSDLSGCPFVVREPASWPRRVFDELIAGLSPPPRITLETSTTEAMKQAVMAGLGLAVVPSLSIAKEVASGDIAILNVDGFPVRGRYSVVHLRGHALSFAGRAFLALVRQGISAASARGVSR